MGQLTDYMQRDHRLCDDHLAALESAVSAGSWPAAESSMQAFAARTERHLQREELVLFPAFERATGMTCGPTAVMRAEHIQIRALLTELEAAVAAHDGKRLLGASDTIMVLIQQHNMKEEQMLYPMADDAIEDPAAVLEALQAQEALE